MSLHPAILGAAAGALLAVIWVAFGGLALLLVIGLSAAGWVLGMVFQRPDFFISLLQRLQER